MTASARLRGGSARLLVTATATVTATVTVTVTEGGRDRSWTWVPDLLSLEMITLTASDGTP